MEIENQKRDLILSQRCVTLTFKLTFESALLIKMMLLLSPMVATFIVGNDSFVTVPLFMI